MHNGFKKKKKVERIVNQGQIEEEKKEESEWVILNYNLVAMDVFSNKREFRIRKISQIAKWGAHIYTKMRYKTWILIFI